MEDKVRIDLWRQLEYPAGGESWEYECANVIVPADLKLKANWLTVMIKALPDDFVLLSIIVSESEETQLRGICNRFPSNIGGAFSVKKYEIINNELVRVF